jgi:hypothetical protein
VSAALRMELASPELTFPTAFCCNCGDLNCTGEIQETRVTRYFAIYGTGNTFRLTLPVCAGCRKTLRRRPSVFFTRALVFLLFTGGWYLALFARGKSVALPVWMDANLLTISAALGAIATVIFYLLRRATPPRTSFYQPVRIKQAKVQFDSVMSGPGNVAYLKLAFTNPDYLNLFVNANSDAIKAGHLAVVRA